jgi:hypothetical protein
MPSFVAGDTDAVMSQHREDRGRAHGCCTTKPARAKAKKEQSAKPCSKNCVDPISPKIGFDLD